MPTVKVSNSGIFIYCDLPGMLGKKKEGYADVRSADDALSRLMMIEGKDMIAPDLEESHSLEHNTRAKASKPDALLPYFKEDASCDICEFFGFEFGVHYPLIEGRLYFSCHHDDAYTLEAIQRDESLFYFSSSVPGVCVTDVNLHVVKCTTARSWPLNLKFEV